MCLGKVQCVSCTVYIHGLFKLSPLVVGPEEGALWAGGSKDERMSPSNHTLHTPHALAALRRMRESKMATRRGRQWLPPQRARGGQHGSKRRAPLPIPPQDIRPRPPARPSSQFQALDGWAHDGRSKLEMQLGLGVQSINEGQGDIHSFEVEDRGKPKGRTSSARPPALRPKAGGSLARDDLLSLDSPASAALRWTVASWAHARSLETQFQSKSPRRESEPRKSQGQTQGRKGETQKQPVKIICCLKPKLPHW